MICGVAASAMGCGQTDGRGGSHGLLERGNELYDVHCATCHESEVGIGPLLNPRVLASYGTARRLLDYTRRTMPYGLPNSLNEDDYWYITAYLIVDRALADGAVLDASSSDSVRLNAGDRPE